jgi:hypothetical protein
MALREILARFGIKVEGIPQLRKGASSLEKFSSRLKSVGLNISARDVLGAVRDFTTAIIDQGDALDKQSKQIGLNTDQLQAWQHAAGLAGVEGGRLTRSIKDLQKSATAAAEGGGEMAETYDRLGVSVLDSNGQVKDANTLLFEVGDALDKVESSSEKVAIANKLMGESGSRLIPMFKGGAAAMREATGELQKFGGGLSAAAIKDAAAAQDAIGRFNLTLLSLKSRLAVAVLPALTRFFEKLAEAGAGLAKITKGTNIVKAALGVLGFASVKTGLQLLKPWLKLLRPLALIALKFIIITLLVDDLITFFEGGDSVIGRFLDKLFGIGAAEKVLWRIRDVVKKVFEGDFVGATKSAIDGLDALGKALVNFFTGETESAATEWASVIGSAVIKWVVDTAGAIGDWFVEAGKSIKVGWQVTKREWMASLAELGQDVINFFDGLADKIAEAFITSLEENTQPMIDAIKKPIKMGIELAKKLIKPGSPSKVYMQLAETIPEGLAAGIDKKAKVAEDSVAGLTNRLINIAGTRISQNINNTISVSGTGQPAMVARRVGSNIGRTSADAFDEAVRALVATTAA